MTNQQIALTIQQSIMESFEQFSSILLKKFNMNPSLAQLPVVLSEPVFGTLDPSFTNFMAPGIILSITFFHGNRSDNFSFCYGEERRLT